KLFKKKENKRLIAEQHMRIFKAIKAKDPDRARKEASSHIDFVEQEIRKIILEELPNT
ncbi:MAG: transcriptional regulator GlcC, partial [Deltaproteobacteria bacterium]